MILNLLKRFNDALLNDSVDFATCHCDRLTKLGLCTLELRRLHLDLLYCYKIVFGHFRRPDAR